MEYIKIDAFHIPEQLVPAIGCIGFFDGIHIGHQQLINECMEIAQKKNSKTCFITFSPDPWTIFKSDCDLHHITTMEDKKKIVSSYGFDYFYCLEFTRDFASLKVEEFHNVLKQLKIEHLVCGFDFRYGIKNSGSVETLKQSGIELSVIDSINSKNLKISTSRIEPLILSGNVLEANQLLGYVYSIEGVVVHGFKRGSSLLKIPTANLQADEEYLIPGVGVYCGYVLYDHCFYQAMINVGNNPTFNNVNSTVEAHILSFDQDIYDQKIRIFFYDKIRDEIKFDGFDALKQQLLKDIETTKDFLKNPSELFDKTQIIWNK